MNNTKSLSRLLSVYKDFFSDMWGDVVEAKDDCIYSVSKIKQLNLFGKLLYSFVVPFICVYYLWSCIFTLGAMLFCLTLLPVLVPVCWTIAHGIMAFRKYCTK